MHRNSLLLFDRHAVNLFRSGMRILEIGPDASPSSFRELVTVADLSWETIDMVARPEVQWVADSEYSFPFPDNSFDLIFSAQVIEHVRMIWKWMRELARVCKPQGHIVTINPVNWPYHEAPVDCWRIYPEGMRSLHEDAGLETVLSVSESLELRTMRYWRQGRPLRSVFLELGRRVFSSERPCGTARDTISIARKGAA